MSYEVLAQSDIKLSDIRWKTIRIPCGTLLLVDEETKSGDHVKLTVTRVPVEAAEENEPKTATVVTGEVVTMLRDDFEAGYFHEPRM